MNKLKEYNDFNEDSKLIEGFHEIIQKVITWSLSIT